MVTRGYCGVWALEGLPALSFSPVISSRTSNSLPSWTWSQSQDNDELQTEFELDGAGNPLSITESRRLHLPLCWTLPGIHRTGSDATTALACPYHSYDRRYPHLVRDMLLCVSAPSICTLGDGRASCLYRGIPILAGISDLHLDHANIPRVDLPWCAVLCILSVKGFGESQSDPAHAAGTSIAS
jgi:hypothetical protein